MKRSSQAYRVFKTLFVNGLFTEFAVVDEKNNKAYLIVPIFWAVHLIFPKNPLPLPLSMI